MADYLHARIYVADDAGPYEIAAAANIAARLAFETISLDLPIGFPISAYEPDKGLAIFVGRAATHIREAFAVSLPDIEQAERFARETGMDIYSRVEHQHQEAPLPSEPRLADMLGSVRLLMLGPDVRSTAVIDLAARVALESAELRLPLVVVAPKNPDGVPPPGSLLIGASNPYVQRQIVNGSFSPPRSPGSGCIIMSDSCVIVAGADPAGEALALEHAASRFPFLWEYGKGRTSLTSIEEDVRRYCPAPIPASELVFDDTYELPWEVEDARQRIRELVLPSIAPDAAVDVDLRLSEPPEIRRKLEIEIRQMLASRGADPNSAIRVIGAHKQGYGWIDEELKPHLTKAARIRILFRELECESGFVDSSDRWLHELYPIDEVLARDLEISVDNITFECAPPAAKHIYEVVAEDTSGNVVAHSYFDPCFVGRTLFDAFPDYARACVATGWIRASVNGTVVVDERIKTDYERFWDEYQTTGLSKIRDYLMQLHAGTLRPECAPHFDQLTVEVELSEPDGRIGIDEERISTLEALHEDIYFETLLFFDVLGTAACGTPLKYPGRIVPRIHPSRAGPGRARVRLMGYRAPFPKDGPFADQSPAVTGVPLRAAGDGPSAVEVSAGPRFSWLLTRSAETAARDRHPPGSPIVQWDEPIGPQECERIIGQLANFPEVRPFLAGRSWLGRPVWAMDVTAPIKGKYFSQARATATKPCLFITGRQHANEVSSTSHILKLVELLATDPEQRKLLDRINFIIHPMANPDGAALVEELHKLTPGFMLHAGYLGALGVDITDQQWSDLSKYPEAHVRANLWRMWQPDVVLNPHGYPSHEWVQLFAGYTAWFRSKSVRLRDWWIPRGWFMPRFESIEDERFPEHRRAALMLRGRIAEGIHRKFGDINARMYRRYAKYTRCELDVQDELLTYASHTPSKPDPESFGFMTRHPDITFFEGLSEAPDEVAAGDWLKKLSAAGLEFSLVHARFLAELPQDIARERWEDDGRLALRISRKRLPLRGGGQPRFES